MRLTLNGCSQIRQTFNHYKIVVLLQQYVVAKNVHTTQPSTAICCGMYNKFVLFAEFTRECDITDSRDMGCFVAVCLGPAHYCQYLIHHRFVDIHLLFTSSRLQANVHKLFMFLSYYAHGSYAKYSSCESGYAFYFEQSVYITRSDPPRRPSQSQSNALDGVVELLGLVLEA